ncbi:MAG TPA: hypothetical protein VGI34_10670, partial [Candidatus Acidoferrales bacterium]
KAEARKKVGREKPMKWLKGFFVALLCISSAIAKPKPVALVHVKLIQGTGSSVIATSDSKSSGIGMGSSEKVYLNVIVSASTPEFAPAVAKNDGKWCLTGNTEIRSDFIYEGLLQGDGIDILIPQVDSKTSQVIGTKKVHFSILAHDWRNLSQF